MVEQKQLDPKFFPRLWEIAHQMGMQAAQTCQVVPMIVDEHIDQLDGNSPIKKSYFVPEGVCGFAWVTVRPANCAFAKWMKTNKDCHLAYGGGMQYWISMFNQSMQLKEAYADAFAEALQQVGIKAYAGSRID